MKKAGYLLVLAAGLLVLSGCGEKLGTAGPLGKKESTGSKMVNSIKDAMGLGQKMECTYTSGTGEGQLVSKVWTEGKKYRGESLIDGKKNYSLFDGEDLMYNWTEGSTSGTKVSIKCMEDIDKASPSEEKEETGSLPASEELGDEAFNDVPEANCQPVSAIDFSLPQGVNFTDICAQLKTQMESLSKLQEKL